MVENKVALLLFPVYTNQTVLLQKKTQRITVRLRKTLQKRNNTQYTISTSHAYSRPYLIFISAMLQQHPFWITTGLEEQNQTNPRSIKVFLVWKFSHQCLFQLSALKCLFHRSRSRLKSTRPVPRCSGIVDNTLTPFDHFSIFDTTEPPPLKQPSSFGVDFKLDFSISNRHCEHPFKNLATCLLVSLRSAPSCLIVFNFIIQEN